MATKLRTFDFSAPSAITAPTEKAVYPWDEWLDGDIWSLTEGEDFDTHPLMMERIIRTRATARGAKVRMRHQPKAGNGDLPFGVIVLQRTDIKGPGESKKAEQAQKRAAKTAEAKKAAAETLKAAGIKPVKNGAKKAAPRKAAPRKVAAKHARSAATKAAPIKATPSKRAARKVSA